MIERKIKITVDKGIDTRSAALFSNVANKYLSSTWIQKENIEVNGKSLMGMISLALIKGDEIVLKVCGSDEAELMDKLTGILNPK